jgi:cytoskeletal protein CcmA (bactofilin family)
MERFSYHPNQGETHLWNKTREEAPRPQSYSEPPAPAPVTHVPAAPPQPAAPAKQKAIICPSMHIKGEIRSSEELVIDGEVEGIVESGSLLTIGPNGKVRANIRAREVVIFGSVKGNIEAIERLAIREQGSLVGDIKTATISIDDGAYFKGSIDISRPEPKVTAKPVKNEAKAG